LLLKVTLAQNLFQKLARRYNLDLGIGPQSKQVFVAGNKKWRSRCKGRGQKFIIVGIFRHNGFWFLYFYLGANRSKHLNRLLGFFRSEPEFLEENSLQLS